MDGFQVQEWETESECLGYGVFFSGDQKVLKLEGSGSLTTSWMHSMPLNCTVSDR